MKKLMLAAAALVAMTGVAHADVEIDTGVCTVTVGEFGISGATLKTVEQDDIDCIQSTANNRAWVVERLGTQVHYYNKATEKLGTSHVNQNGAYWGDVMSARNAIDAKNAQISDLIETSNENYAAASAAQSALYNACYGLKIAYLLDKIDENYVSGSDFQAAKSACEDYDMF